MVLRRRNFARRVQLHLEGAGGGSETIEGVQLHPRVVGGHYLLHQPRYLESEQRAVPLDGHLEVPCERVWFIQVLAEGERG